MTNVVAAELSPSNASTTPRAGASGGESPAARPTSSGANPDDRREAGSERENVQPGQVADLAAGNTWCPTCGRSHQNREHSVPCEACGRSTFEVHRVCASCKAKRPT